MKFISTRDFSSRPREVSFKEAVVHCMSRDGGLYIPSNCEDLRKWILYADENTSFANLAGTLTSALINTEFSPLICETIASRAFEGHDPVLKQLDKDLFILELNHGPTGTIKDYGVAYLISVLETILQYDGEKSILLDATSGELGACMAKALRGKKLVKSVLLAPKGKFRGMEESDFAWNGGNIYPIEVDGTEEDCHNLIRAVFARQDLVEKYSLTVANTSNIGRLLPQAFFYVYAFSHLKKSVDGDIYYALAAGNYGNIVSGLYAWMMSLPVNGFFVPSTSDLCLDATGNCTLLNSMVSLEKRKMADPADPSNLERLEAVFKANQLLMKSFLFPSNVSSLQTEEACRSLYKKYGVIADRETSSAYAASLLRKSEYDEDGSAVVLMQRTDPSFDSTFISHNLGEKPVLPENVRSAVSPVQLERACIAPGDLESLISVLNSLNLLRIF